MSPVATVPAILLASTEIFRSLLDQTVCPFFDVLSPLIGERSMDGSGRKKRRTLRGEAGLKNPTSPHHFHIASMPCDEFCDGHPPHVILNDSISSLMFNLLKSLARLFGVKSSSVPLKSLSE